MKPAPHCAEKAFLDKCAGCRSIEIVKLRYKQRMHAKFVPRGGRWAGQQIKTIKP